MCDTVKRLRRAAFVRFKDGFESNDLAEKAAREIECLLRDRDYWRKRAEETPALQTRSLDDFAKLASELDIDWVRGLFGSTEYGSGDEFLADVARRLGASVPQDHVGGLPEGWKLVPFEPTPFMIAAAISVDWRRGDDIVRMIWQKMLSDAPKFTAGCQTCDGTGNEGRHSICRDCDGTPSSQTNERVMPLTKTQIETLANNIHNVNEYGYTIECLTHHLSENALSTQPDMTAIDLLKQAIRSAEESMAADAPDGETVEPAACDVVIPYEDAKRILGEIFASPVAHGKRKNSLDLGVSSQRKRGEVAALDHGIEHEVLSAVLECARACASEACFVGDIKAGKVVGVNEALLSSQTRTVGDAHIVNLVESADAISMLIGKVGNYGGKLEYRRGMLRNLADLLRNPPAPTHVVQVTYKRLRIGDDARSFISDAIRSAYDSGYNDARNASSVPGDRARAYRGQDQSKEIGDDLLARLAGLPAPPSERSVGLDVDRLAASITASAGELELEVVSTGRNTVSITIPELENVVRRHLLDALEEGKRA